jgi:alcohol dehydrogenase class IV
VPTTYAGSEQTSIYGLTGGRRKETGKNAIVQPKAVVYDPELTLGLPAFVTGPSAFNALAHSVEALYAPGNNPVTSALALEGVRAIHDSLPTVMATPDDVEARGVLLYGAYLSGVALGSTSTGLHHKLCHVLGGTFNLPHAQTHTIVLPHVVAYNAAAAPDAMRRVAAALGVADAAQGLFDLAVAIGARTALKDIGMPEDGLERAASLATTQPYYNPAPLRGELIRELLRHAFEGRRPQPF